MYLHIYFFYYLLILIRGIQFAKRCPTWGLVKHKFSFLAWIHEVNTHIIDRIMFAWSYYYSAAVLCLFLLNRMNMLPSVQKKTWIHIYQHNKMTLSMRMKLFNDKYRLNNIPTQYILKPTEIPERFTECRLEGRNACLWIFV